MSLRGPTALTLILAARSGGARPAGAVNHYLVL
jgi:hypothetical protein